MKQENKFLKGLKKENNLTETENGAIALKSTMNYCLDAFGSLGGLKNASEDYIIPIFSKAFNENRVIATKMLFYMRDIRGGQGLRNLFRVILKWLSKNHKEYVIHNLDNILKFGRGDDILCLFDTPCENEIIQWAKKVLDQDLDSMRKNIPCSLLAKWMPSENTSSKESRALARKFMQGFKISAKEYRQMLSKLRRYLKIVERNMSANTWNKIEYSEVPAKASLKYSNAFFNHDEDRYCEYITELSNGNSKVNAASLFPVDIVERIFSAKKRNMKNPNRKDILLYDAMWKALPDYFKGRDESSICVVDTSGSMMGNPENVAISLGIYCAERCKGPFHNHFITFSRNPELQEVIGSNIYEKINNLSNADWGYNTDLEAVFNLLLDTAINNKCDQSEMPNKLYIISDMQFDEATEDCGYYGSMPPKKNKKPFMQTMKEKYTAAGYTMPSIVYWNVGSYETGIFQDTFEGENCCMVSGYSPSIVKSVMEGTTYEEEEISTETGETKTVVKEKIDPIAVMMAALTNERYNTVWVG